MFWALDRLIREGALATLKYLEQLEQYGTGGAACVTLKAAQETVRAAQAGVERAEVIARTVHAQANAELRPGADASRTDAELAAARTLLIQAEQAVDIARVNVSQFVGLPPAQITISAPRLLQTPPEQPPSPKDAAMNPLSVEQNALVAQLKAQFRILERAYFPRFFAQLYGGGVELESTAQGCIFRTFLPISLGDVAEDRVGMPVPRPRGNVRVSKA